VSDFDLHELITGAARSYSLFRMIPHLTLARVVAVGRSRQRPTGRALERDEEKIRTWKQKRWPEWKLPDVGRLHDLKGRRRRRFGDPCR
jgi:hypothetical protein